MLRLIYGLIDPITNELRYVGKSSRGMKRPLEHAKHARKSVNPRSHLYRWIKKIQESKVDPEIVVLEEGHANEDDLNEAERFFIAYFRSIGSRLTNGTAGGDGVDSASAKEIGSRPEIREMRSRIARENQASDSYREMMSRSVRNAHIADPTIGDRISQKTRGRPKTAEHIAKISAGVSLSMTPERRAINSAYMRSRVISEETRERMKAAARNRSPRTR